MVTTLRLIYCYKFVLFFLLAAIFLSCDDTPDRYDDIIEFSRHIENAMKTDDSYYINESFDYGSLAKFALEKLDMTEKIVIEAVAGKLKNNLSLGSELLRNFNPHLASFRFVNYYEEYGADHLVFKYEDGSNINYLDFQVYFSERRQRVMIVDIYNFFEGESISAQYVRALLLGLQFKNGDAGLYSNSDNTFFQAFEKLKKVEYLNGIGEWEEALKLYNTISLQFKSRDFFLRKKIKVFYSMSDSQGLAKEMQRYEKEYPNDKRYILFMRLLNTSDAADRSLYEDQLARYIGRDGGADT